MFSVIWPEAVGIHHLKYQSPPSLSARFTVRFATHVDIYTHFPPFLSLSLSLLYTCFTISPHVPSFSPVSSFLPINSHFKLFFASIFFFSFHLLLPLHHSLCFPLFPRPALSLSSSFDGLVVGGTDSARLELLSQCEMCCCGDDMSHFTLDW